MQNIVTDWLSLPLFSSNVANAGPVSWWVQHCAKANIEVLVKSLTTPELHLIGWKDTAEWYVSCMLETTGLACMMASPCSTRPEVLLFASTTYMIRCCLLRRGWFRRPKLALQAIQGYHVVASILAVQLIINLGEPATRRLTVSPKEDCWRCHCILLFY